MDTRPPSGGFSHVQLLDGMTRPTPGWPAVISEQLRESLRQYLDFRHVFRHAYSFQLQWSKMAALVLGVEGTLRQLESELKRFLTEIEGKKGSET